MNASITDIGEGDLIDRRFDRFITAVDFVRMEGIPDDVMAFTRIPLNGLGRSGDVDILLYSTTQPDITTAVEAKRIKISARTFCSGTPNKLGELRRAVDQANRLADAGFSQVYLFILVGIDQRGYDPDQDEGETLSKLKATVRESVSDCVSRLNEQIGLYRIDFIQRENMDPVLFGGRVGELHRLAPRVTQYQSLTAWAKKQAATRRPVFRQSSLR